MPQDVGCVLSQQYKCLAPYTSWYAYGVIDRVNHIWFIISALGVDPNLNVIHQPPKLPSNASCFEGSINIASIVTILFNAQANLS